MFVTEELKRKVRTAIGYMDARSRWLTETAALPTGWAESDDTRRYAAERAIMVSVESVTDIASDIIDALVMRDAGSYADLVKVLVEEQVIDESWFRDFLPCIETRQQLLRAYRDVSAETVEQTVRQIAPLLPAYRDWIWRYLQL